MLIFVVCLPKDRCSSECGDCCPNISVCEQCFRLAEVCDCQVRTMHSCWTKSCPSPSVSNLQTEHIKHKSNCVFLTLLTQSSRSVAEADDFNFISLFYENLNIIEQKTWLDCFCLSVMFIANIVLFSHMFKFIILVASCFSSLNCLVCFPTVCQMGLCLHLSAS